MTEAAPEQDMLVLMMRLQKEMQEATYGYDFNNMTVADKVEFIHWNTTAGIDEAHEALAETSWKPWAKGDFLNREAYKGELVDEWHFFMNKLIVAGITPHELYESYLAKRRINIQRQVDGYDGVSTKCPVCKRALDDPAVECEPGICKNGGQ